MAEKRKTAISKTSLKGKHLKINQYKLGKNRTHSKFFFISPEIKHNNLGNYQKNGKKTDGDSNLFLKMVITRIM